MLSWFDWTPAQALQRVNRDLLRSGDAAQQAAGLAACVIHRIDPGAALVAALAASDVRLRARALRVTGEAGRVDLLPQAVAACVADAYFVPWLIGQMADLQASRLAGEAFMLMTGADLSKLDLERKPPEGASDGLFGGPNEDPADDNVALDEDESLPWPDPERVQGWWQANQGSFPAAQRFFMGAGPSPAQSLKVLRDGTQRQRIAAAQWASLLTPGTKLFPTAAPAWRQQRWLKERL